MKINVSGANKEDEKYEKQSALDRKAQEEQRLQKKAELDSKLKEREKARKLRLEQQRLELIKMKQGIKVDDPDLAPLTDEPKPEMNKKQKVQNFWYQHSMYIILGIIVLLLGTILIVNIVRREEPDVSVMILADDGFMDKSQEIKELIERYAVDSNDDGKNIASIVPCPIKGSNLNPSQESAYYTKMYGEVQAGKTMLFISDKKVDEVILPETIMFDLTERYPDNPKVTKTGFKLTGDKLREVLGWEGMPQDTYIGIRNPAKVTGQTAEKAQEQFDEAMKVMEGLIRDFS